MKSDRYKKILEENKKFEQESPYNFCDRWCERCTHEKQMRCRLYLDDLERRVSCIAHGREEDDPEITEAVLEKQFEGIEEKLQETAKKFNIDLDNLDEVDESYFDEEDRVELEDLPKEIQEHIKFIEDYPLPKTVDQYREKAFSFLEETFFEKKIPADLKYDFDTVSWYYTLLSAKLHRAMAGFHEQHADGEFAFYDSVAQFIICRKSITESLTALRKIKPYYPTHKNTIIELIVLLHNIHSRIEALEESI